MGTDKKEMVHELGIRQSAQRVVLHSLCLYPCLSVPSVVRISYMTNLELRDTAEARRYLVECLWWQRIRPVGAEQVPAILEWAFAIVAEGEPLPPLGFLADVGHLIFRANAGVAALSIDLPSTLVRAYEDHVLGKLFADSAFERAADALRSYPSADRAKGLAFLVNQMRPHVGYGGALLSPGLVKSLRAIDADELLNEGWQAIEQAGPMPLLVDLYEQLVGAFRGAANTVAAEDIFELERRTAIAPFGQRVALRQVLQAAKMLDESLPQQKPRTSGRRHEVPTRLLEEDTYPVGGFASISTRGSIESLLHSQLAFMEADDRPDLFDIKFLRDELLYYSRDENNFLRRRRTFVIALYPDLIQARVKDTESPWQRIVWLLAVVQTAVRKLIDWLHADALVFELVLIEPKDGPGLAAEAELLAVLLAEQIANGTVRIDTAPADQLAARCTLHSRRSMCQALLASVKEQTHDVEGAVVSRLVIDGPVPALDVSDGELERCESWSSVLERLLTEWIETS
jgi:hypothetical protein